MSVVTFDYDKMRFKSGADALFHDLAAVLLGLNDDGGADKLFRLVEYGTLCNKEAEGAVRLARPLAPG